MPLLISFKVIRQSVSDGCEDRVNLNDVGYHEFESSGKFYKMYPSDIFVNAKAKCLSEGAFLAMPKTREELDHIHSLVWVDGGGVLYKGKINTLVHSIL